jgi:hypothetical protein
VPGNLFLDRDHLGGRRRVGPNAQPFGVIDQWLRDVVDPLVKSGKLRWATFSEMAGERK